jgi:acetylornithine/N-succinyldiaminopimelate aminotransferase
MPESIMPTYRRLPVTFTHGEGTWLWDTGGKKYLDALSGIAVCGLGHAHPAIAEALCDQARKLIHTTNLYGIANQQVLAAELARISGMENVFFGNSGAEAVEAAIKLARLYGHNKGVQQPAIIVAENSFHGRTLATLSATGNRKVQAGFEPLVQGFIRTPYNNVEALQTIAKNSSNVVAVLLEPIQGEGGINIPAPDYLDQVREICDKHEWLMMLDEIQTGMCRTGQWFAYQHSNMVPDVIAIAKGLGNGVPIGACLARGKAAGVFQPGHHGSTFGGNPLACRAGLTVIKTLEEQQLVKRAAVLGDKMLEHLRETLAGCGHIKDIRGKGLMIGIELTSPCTELAAVGLEKGILFSIQADKVIRLLPPLIISDDEADQIVHMVAGIVKAYEPKTH